MFIQEKYLWCEKCDKMTLHFRKNYLLIVFPWPFLFAAISALLFVLHFRYGYSTNYEVGGVFSAMVCLGIVFCGWWDYISEAMNAPYNCHFCQRERKG